MVLLTLCVMTLMMCPPNVKDVPNHGDIIYPHGLI